MADRDQDNQPRRPIELFGEVVLDDPQAIDDMEVADAPDSQVSDVPKPITRESSRERIDRLEREEEEEGDYGLIDGGGTAIQSSWLAPLASDQVTGYEPDPTWENTPEKILEVAGDDISEEAFDYLVESSSQAELEARAERTRLQQEREGKLAQLGWKGQALKVGVELFDPVAWGVGAAASSATGGLSLVGTAAQRLNKAQRVLRAGAMGATGNLAVETAIRENKPIYDDINMLYSAGLGFGIAGGLSALSRNPATHREAQSFVDTSESLKRQAESEAVDFSQETLNYRPGENEFQGLSMDAGAAGTRRAEPLSPEDSDLEPWVDRADRDDTLAPRTAWGKTGGLTSSVVKMMDSDNPVTRALGHVFGENAIGTKNRNIVAPTPATQKQMQLQRKMELRWMRDYKKNFNDFRKERGSGAWNLSQRGVDEREFTNMVSDYVEGIRTDVPAPVKAQGETLRSLFEEYRVNLNQPGAATGEHLRAPDGFGTVPEDRNWLPHEPSQEAFNRMTREYGNRQLEVLFARAVKRTSDDITEEQAMKAGRAYVKTMRELRVGLGKDAGRILGSGDAEEIKRLIKEGAPDMDDAEVEDMIDGLTARKSGKGTGPQHGKKRLPLDMETTLTMRPSPTSGRTAQAREVSIREFFNRDAHDLFLKYNRRMSGSLALSRTRVEGLFDGITNTNEFETMKRKIREAGEMKGMSRGQIDTDVDQFEYLYKSVMGIPQQGQAHKAAETMRRFRDFQFARVMGQVGFSQFPEVGQAATGVGLKATLKSVPSFKAMWRDAKTGKIKDELVDELEMATAEGSDWLRTLHIDRFDEMTGHMDTSMSNRMGQAYDNTIRKANRAVSAGSGMSSINTFSQRFAMTGIANRFDEMARGGRGWSPQRTRSMGLADEDVQKILDEINTHAEHKNGLTGKKLKKLNLDKWDAHTRSTFEDSLYRYSRRLVQQNDPGQFRPWMSNPVAQMLLQFRTFIIGAHTKALMHNIHMRDFQTFSTFAVSSAFGALGYISREYVGSAFDEESQEHLEERLSVSNVAKAAFERSSWAALIPMATDSMLTGTGFEPMFDYRSTAQPTDIVFGSPTVDHAGAISDFIGAITQPAVEGRMPSQDELKSGLRAWPFHNTNGVVQVSNLLLGESGLPEDAPQD